MFRVSLGLRVGGLVAVVVAAIGLPTVLVASTLPAAVEANGWVDHTRVVLNTIEHLQLLMADVEGGARGFAFTRQPDLQNLYERAAEAGPAATNELAELTADQPVQRAAVARLRALIDEQRRVAEALVNVGQAPEGATEAALALPPRIRSVTGQIRSELRAMRTFEQELLAMRVAAARSAITQTGQAIAIGAVTALVLALTGTIALTRSITAPIARLLDGVTRLGRGELDWRVHTARGDAGELKTLTTSFNEMVERRRAAEAALHAAREEADAANRELDAFSYSVSHDLRAPLRTIDGFARALEEDAAHKLDPESIEHLQRIRNGAQRMSMLIDALLGLSRVTRTELRREHVDLSQIAREVMSTLPADHSIELHCEDRLVALADPRLVRIALTNLLGNAVKFTSRMKATARVDVGRREVGGTWAFFVRDNGAGFEPQYTDKLFTAFQRLHRVTDFEGSGIGLATTARVVRRHGGRIWAEGEVDRGATFFFTLEPQT